MKSKKNIRRSFTAIFFAGIMVLSVFAMMCTTASAATEDKIEQSIVDGLAWLAPQQLSDGSWNNNPGITGLVLLKFIERAKELGYDDPKDPDYAYSQNVIDGLAYLDSKLINVGVGAGYDGNGNNNMVNLGGTYYTSIATMAYSANPGTDPNLVQDLTDWLVNAQCTDDTTAQNGVWGYSGFSCYGDNSNTGYATLGLGFAVNAGATIPDSTKTALSSYVDYIQNDPGNADDGTEDDPDGGSGYSAPTYWVNSLKTGNLIFEAVLSGDDPDSARILNAVDYIDRHWDDDIEGWIGNPPSYNTQYQATFAIMKGLESIGLEDLNGTDWFDEMSTVIVNDQALDGRWTGCPAYVWPSGSPSAIQSDELCTAWALLTLEKVIPNHPPVADAGPDQIVEQDSLGGASVTLNGSDSYDPDNDPLTYSWTWNGESDSGVNPIVSLPLGDTEITLVVNDGTVDSEPDIIIITVEDTTPPEVGCLETVNPHGNNIPGEKNWKDTNEDGFYELKAKDICDVEPELYLMSIDVEATADLLGAFDASAALGPYPSGYRVKYTESNGATEISEKKIGSANDQADAIDSHVKGPHDLVVFAMDDYGNLGVMTCLVPPPPK